MSKVKMLVLILLVAVVVYYWENQSRTQPKPPSLPFKPRASPDSSLPLPFLPPQPRIVSPNPNVLNQVEWPSNVPYYEPEAVNCPGTQWEPETVNCPAFIPESELSEEEKALRQQQEQADYEWLLNNKTLADWHQEGKVSDDQYQVLRELVNPELMTTWNCLLDLLPENWEWWVISGEFKEEELREAWISAGFTREEIKEWLDIGLKVEDSAFAAWLRDVKGLEAEEVLNWGDIQALKEEYKAC